MNNPVVGRLTIGDITVFLVRDGYYVRRQDTSAILCHISRLRSLAELSPKIQVEETSK